MRRVVFTDAAWEDYCSWAADTRMLRRVNGLIDEARRLVHSASRDELVVVQARYHY